MKYIRTELHGIALVKKEDKNGISYENAYHNGYFLKSDTEYKQADTIDKLCDTFVICVDKQGYLIIDDYKKAMEIMQRNDDYNAVCYGAIWTDKGLIYVAKMNEKGELELL